MSLLCAYRKLSLIREISRRELLSVVLSQKARRIQMRMAEINKASASIRSSIDMCMKSAERANGLVIQTAMSKNQESVSDKYQLYNKADQTYQNAHSNFIKMDQSNAEYKNAEIADNDAKSARESAFAKFQYETGEVQKSNNRYAAELQATQMGASIFTGLVDKIFDSANDSVMDVLERDQSSIEMEMANNASMLERDKAELESVKKEEKEGVKREVATFGLD